MQALLQGSSPRPSGGGSFLEEARQGHGQKKPILARSRDLALPVLGSRLRSQENLPALLESHEDENLCGRKPTGKGPGTQEGEHMRETGEARPGIQGKITIFELVKELQSYGHRTALCGHPILCSVS